MTRRQVRVTASFFDRLDELLPPERGADGAPSATDFLLHDLPTIIDLLAVLIAAGVLVPFVSVYAVLAADAIEVIYVELG